MAHRKRIRLVSMRMWVCSLALLSGSRIHITLSCCVGCRHSSDLAWLWHRLTAVASIHPLAWELPYALGVALKSKKKEHM